MASATPAMPVTAPSTPRSVARSIRASAKKIMVNRPESDISSANSPAGARVSPVKAKNCASASPTTPPVAYCSRCGRSQGGDWRCAAAMTSSVAAAATAASADTPSGRMPSAIASLAIAGVTAQIAPAPSSAARLLISRGILPIAPMPRGLSRRCPARPLCAD
jgi:hypothetical protein